MATKVKPIDGPAKLDTVKKPLPPGHPLFGGQVLFGPVARKLSEMHSKKQNPTPATADDANRPETEEDAIRAEKIRRSKARLVHRAQPDQTRDS